jgi:ankyrin repeat protein
MENDPEAVAILLKYGADPNYVPIFQNRNYTPLRLAASRGNQQTMALLLENGADASGQGTGTLGAYLLHRSREATPNAEDLQIVIALLEKYGFTMPTALENSPMEYAAIYGDTQAMQLLISDYAVDANACIDNGRTILHIYVRSGHQIATAEKVAAILAFGTDPTIVDEDGKTAYDYAAEKGYEDIAQMLQLDS